MKQILVLFFIFITINTYAYRYDAERYRALLQLSYENVDSAKYFYKTTRDIQDSATPLLLGYKAMADLLMCNFTKSPFSKLTYFNRGKRLLERAIERDQNNAQLRFMRFCTQDNIPLVLNYKDQLQSDKNYLIDYLKKTKGDEHPEFKITVKSYLLKTDRCNSYEKLILQNL